VEKSGLLGHGLLDGPDKKERFMSLLAFYLFIYLLHLYLAKKIDVEIFFLKSKG
jgi:hypothetical protein